LGIRFGSAWVIDQQILSRAKVAKIERIPEYLTIDWGYDACLFSLYGEVFRVKELPGATFFAFGSILGVGMGVTKLDSGILYFNQSPSTPLRSALGINFLGSKLCDLFGILIFALFGITVVSTVFGGSTLATSKPWNISNFNTYRF
jgi:hypothetical protein